MPQARWNDGFSAASLPAHSPAWYDAAVLGLGHQNPRRHRQQPLLPGYIVVAALQHRRIDVFGGDTRRSPRDGSWRPGDAELLDEPRRSCCSRVATAHASPSLRLRHYAGAIRGVAGPSGIRTPARRRRCLPGRSPTGPRPGRPRRRADAHPGALLARAPADGGRLRASADVRAGTAPTELWSSRARCSGWHDRLRPRWDRHALPAAGGGAGGGAGRLRR